MTYTTLMTHNRKKAAKKATGPIMSSLMLWCLLWPNPTEKAIPIEIEDDKVVGILKVKLKEHIQGAMAQDLILWKVSNPACLLYYYYTNVLLEGVNPMAWIHTYPPRKCPRSCQNGHNRGTPKIFLGSDDWLWLEGRKTTNQPNHNQTNAKGVPESSLLAFVRLGDT